ncbi:MAG: FecR family protein [Burkholderiaceae bacterium]|jgi:transmembrane sensor|nr:FecR family protein [Burkholderiaceae bacterium]
MSDEQALDAAIDWMVLLQSGQASAGDRARLQAWCQAHPRHAQAWEQVQAALQRSLQPLQTTGTGTATAGARAAHSALRRPRPRRRLLGSALALAGLGLGTAWLLRHTAPAAPWLADMRTGTGERRRLRLQDGSEIVLNARSAVDLAFDAQARNLYLRAGEIIVEAAPDAARPLSVHTAQGLVQALGTRFLVRQGEGFSEAMVLEHSVRVQTLSGAQCRLEQGQAVRFDTGAIDTLSAGRQQALAGWEHGMLALHDRPLSELVEALRPYRQGFMRLSPAAARLQVLGVFPLDDSDRALDALEQTLPVRITRHGGWLVSIDVATP